MNGLHFRRRIAIRAYADKLGGWTLVASGGTGLRLSNASSLVLWDAADGEGAALSEICTRLKERFPDIDALRLRRDARSFLLRLERLGLVEFVKPPGLSGRCKHGS